MLDISAILASLRLVEFGVEKLKGRLSKKQRQQITSSAIKLIKTATDDEVEKYAVAPQRRAIEKSIAGSKLTQASRRSRPAKKKLGPALRPKNPSVHR